MVTFRYSEGFEIQVEANPIAEKSALVALFVPYVLRVMVPGEAIGMMAVYATGVTRIPSRKEADDLIQDFVAKSLAAPYARPGVM
jgi:hypothetical protein